ncbi:MAG: methyl-accepting chemotaxis protein, partial [Rhodoferax sp.]|nr:methyl-accepting chemotaxis protein [Rhodoferax sp.]
MLLSLSALRSARPKGNGSAAPRAWRDFFAYHGIWALGVRPLRRISVRAKVMLLLGILGVPLAALSVNLLLQYQQSYSLAQQRLAGVRLVAAVSQFRVELGTGARAVETGQTPGNDDRVAVHGRLVTAMGDALATGLGLGASWERARAAVERAVQAADLPHAARRPVDAQALLATQALRDDAVAATQAQASRDSALSATADLALGELPTLQTSLALLRRAVVGLAGQDGAASADRLVKAAVTFGEVQRLWTQVQQPIDLLEGGKATTGALRLEATRQYLDWAQREALAQAGTIDLQRHAALYDAARTEVSGLRTGLTNRLEAALAVAMDRARQARNGVAIVLAVCLVTAAFIVYSFFLVMNGGLRQLSVQMERMADGKLTARLHPRGDDEVAQTMRDMTRALVRLSDLLASVRQTAASVNQSAQTVAHGNADLSRRNAETAQHLAAVLDGVERYARELTACGRDVEQVVDRVQNLRLASTRNRKHMGRLSQRMDQLRVSSREIGEIVRVIDGIAFRTNILALNASVEASKAGDAGRGFAIVAQEVRSLALRSADASRRIGDIVARSGQDVDACGALVQETSAALAGSDEQIDAIHQSVERVAAMSRDGQSEASALKGGLVEINGASEENLRLVKQLAEASGQLQSHGDRLLHKI